MSVNLPLNFNNEVGAVKEYYADLLILQYRTMQKARATIGIGAQLYLGDGLIFQLPYCLDIDTAIGAQLDLIGKIVQADRFVQGIELDKDWFSFEKINAIGFSTQNVKSKGSFKSWFSSGLSKYQLLDEDYRTLLKFKIVDNNQIAGWGHMDDAIYSVFGDDIRLINNKDLSITYMVKDANLIALRAAVLKGYLKAPLSIRLSSIILVPDLNQIFGFSNKYKTIDGGFSTKNNLVNGTFLSKANIKQVNNV